MADLSVTAVNVLQGTGATVLDVTAGTTITAGDLVYEDTTDSNEYKLADAGAEASAVLAGMALNGASDGQPLRIITKGPVNPGATATVGEVYVVSETAGGIAPIGDLLSGDYVAILGVATTTSNIQVDINASGVAKA